ncbi:hypothetical protein [Thioalkalivibrio sp. HK1]|uniref:hypothetical protein n=1 Tax=Thioalkalivibrio sp. HK1 TaxID=1469245 RepID=UPI00047093B1|nr:hypothetical protein [Thioalkalivibrio sp. HK1]
MLFGFAGAVHADASCTAEGCPPSASAETFKAQDVIEAMDAIEESMSARVCHPIFGCTGLKPEDGGEESEWIRDQADR